MKESVPLVLHCASLSLAGNCEPAAELVEALKYWIKATETPWLGEHIAYVRADGVLREIAEHQALVGRGKREDDEGAEGDSSDRVFNVGYTVSPQLSTEILDRVAEAATRWSAALEVPIILENGPIYFTLPGSVMTQTEFIRKLCERLPEGGLLLDLSHFAITCSNLGWEPMAKLEELPLERVTEVHLSGARLEGGVVWDDHAAAAPEVVFQLLARLLSKAAPRAITLGYNWDANFPLERLEGDLDRVRCIVEENVAGE